MSNYKDNALKHMLEMLIVGKYLEEFYKNSSNIITYTTPELIANSPKSTEEIIKIFDEKMKLVEIINIIYELSFISPKIENILSDSEDNDLIMTISLCNYIEELYKDFDNIAIIIENLLKISIIPELINITNDLNKKICDLKSTSMSELLDIKSYMFTK